MLAAKLRHPSPVQPNHHEYFWQNLLIDLPTGNIILTSTDIHLPLHMGRDGGPLTYRDLFPDAKFTIEVAGGSENIHPADIRSLVQNILMERPKCPGFRVQHRALCRHVVWLCIEGLDQSRFVRYGIYLPTFATLGSPLVVLAKVQGSTLQRAAQAALGIEVCRRKRHYESLEEMIPPVQFLATQGFPLPEGEARPLCRRARGYRLEELREEELATYQELPVGAPQGVAVAGLDCEMVGVEGGAEVGRVSVVGDDLAVLCDHWLKPEREVVDWRTHVSGLTRELIDARAERRSGEAVELLGECLSRDTIIVGHALENDFRALHLIHRKVIDTSLLYNVNVNPSGKPSLAHLVGKYLSGGEFRAGGAHDSVEDARAAMQLAQHALVECVHEDDALVRGDDWVGGLLEAVAAVSWVVPPRHAELIDRHDGRVVVREAADIVSAGAALEEALADPAPLVLGLVSLTQVKPDTPEEVDAYEAVDAMLARVLAVLPEGAALILYSGNGNPKRLGRPDAPGVDLSAELERCRQGLLWFRTP